MADERSLNELMTEAFALLEKAITRDLAPVFEQFLVIAQNVNNVFEAQARECGMTVDEYLKWLGEINRLEAEKYELECRIGWKQSALELRRKLYQQSLTKKMR